MQLLEIEEHIKPLSRRDKIRLMEDIATMLGFSADDALLRRLRQAATTLTSSDCGPLEAYTAASQLHELLQKESLG